MTADATTHYVKTTDAQAAVRGHEEEILRACGIDWHSGKKHIRCPYPHHGGADDWRWDGKDKKAFCTCQDRNKPDSIFDVVGKVDGLDFDASKIRCVEIVGEPNLIRQKSNKSGGNFQATDAKSLLNAPADRRDDTLPRAYLAHRLGVEAAAVLMPSTPTVGHRALTYYDPPKTAKGKPVDAGAYPCAVFGTTDVEEKIHAHRIYLAAGGAGKADLGVQDNGSPRDPKKSAKRPDGGESTAGRSVLWGDPKVAAWIIVAEGVETAAAVAYAFRDEITGNKVAVASAINAGGIEAFKPWPVTQRVTIAADRDEAAKITRPTPSRRGERAARVFGIRNQDRVAVSIAMAGDEGTSTDWLDIHTSKGTEAVRAGILAAVAFRATDEEAKEERDRVYGVAEVADIAVDYPLPAMETMRLDYQRTESGRVLVHRWVKVEDEVVPVPIATPFGVAARLRFVDDGDAYGLRIVVQDMGGKRRTIDVDRAAFARQGATDTRAMLFGAGLRTEGEGEGEVVKCLKGADPQNEITVVRRPGWSDINGLEDRFFVCPSGKVIGAAGANLPELSVNSRISSAVATGGTLDGWKAAVAAACSAPRCEHWVIGAIAGFAAPLVSLCGFDTCGINLSGMTSGGKTTAQRLAVSSWSRASLDQRDSLLQSARATANGIEAMASRSNGTILALDELGHVHGKELGKIIYSLASGVGKGRMTAEAQMRQSHTWSTFVVLSAEKSLEEKVRGDGGEWAGGMAVRIPDIDITGVNRAVDHAVLAQIQTVDRHYGHAGPAFIEAMVAGGYHQQAQEIRDGVNELARTIAGSEGDGKHVRAAAPFAILCMAGNLAKKFGLLPSDLNVLRAVQWAWERFSNSTDAVSLDPEQQATTNLRTWIAERWGSTIQATVPDDNSRPPNRDAFGWYDEDAVYIPTRRIVEAAGGALKEIEISRALDKQGFIAKRHDASCLYVSYIPKIGKVKAYALSRAAFGRSGHLDNGFRLHAGGRAS